MINAGLMSSVRPDWNTPANVLEAVREFDEIGLDPCSNASSIVGARESWDEAFNGLRYDWHGRGLVYVNSPYGRPITQWQNRCLWEAIHNKAEIISLVPARTDAKWWHGAIAHADAICFWRGRLKFLGATSSAPFPSALAYWGTRAGRFSEVFSERGMVVRP